MKQIHLYLFLSLLVPLLLTQCDSVTSTGSEDEIAGFQPELIAPSNQSESSSTSPQLRWERFGSKSESGMSDKNSNNNYQLVISISADFEDPAVDTLVSRSSHRVRGLESETDYYWRVRLRSDRNSSRWSSSWHFRTRDSQNNNEEEPDEPIILELTWPEDDEQVEPGTVPFEWNGSDEVSEYHFQLTTKADFSEIAVDRTVNSTSANVTVDEEGEEYYWRVAPVLQSDESEWSDVWSFATPEPEGGHGDDEDQEPTPTTDINPEEFVQVEGGNFVIDGDLFRFAGTNAYYLPNYQKIDSRVVTRAFDAFEDAGITAIRMWAFYDGYDCGYSQHDASEAVIQTAPGEYSEEALRYLDQVIAEGKQRGMRFILPFVNYWDELGGICQYNTWAGASKPGRNMNYFLNNDDTQRWFRDYIEMLLNRVNTETGIAYKDEPAIMAWQVINEGRNSGQDPQILRDWYQEIARHIKDLGARQLIGTGEEGFDEGTPSEYSVNSYSNTYVLRANEGTSYIMNTAIPEIDFGSAHWYAPDYGFGSSITEDLLEAQRAWLDDHVAIAKDMDKPFILGEYGFPGWGDSRVRDSYNELWDHAEDVGLDGSLLWQFTADYIKCTEFGGNICWPDGRQDDQLFADFRDHIRNINSME